MAKRITLPANNDSDPDFEIKSGEQGRRDFIKQVLGGSLMLVTLPTLGTTIFKRGVIAAKMERTKQEYIEKFAPPGYDPFAHRWAYGIDAYKCIGHSQRHSFLIYIGQMS